MQREINKIRKSFGNLWSHSSHRIMARLLESYKNIPGPGCRAATIYSLVTKEPIENSLALAREMGWEEK